MADSKSGRNTLRKMAAGALCLQMGLCMPFTAAYAEEAPAVVAGDGRVTVSAGPETAEAAPAEGTIVVPGGAEAAPAEGTAEVPGGAEAAPAANTEEPKVPAPVTQEGRYEADENLLLPGFSYTPNTSHEVDGRQGVAFADGSYYVSGSTTISCYDGDWNLIASAEKPFEGLPEGTNHIGDIDVYNGSVYAGVEYFADGAADKAVIAVYDAKTLILTDTYAVDPASGQTEVSGIAVDPDNQTIWLTSWDESESGSSLYRYDLETGDYLGKVLLQPAPEYIQGIAYYDGWLYLTADDGVADEGEPDHIYRCRADLSIDEYPVVLERTLDDVAMQGEIEGISFDPGKKQLLVSYNRGARIIAGMPVGFYEGYDREVHEVYAYDMKRIIRPLNYGISTYWVEKPQPTSKVADADVFFILPTVNMKVTVPDNEDVTNLRTASRFVKTYRMEQGIADLAGDVYAPYYRQANMACYVKEDGTTDPGMTGPDGINADYGDIAYADVRDAWMYYMEHYNKDRPFVIFSYSQGADMALRLLEEFGEDEAFSDHLVAAYLIGVSIPEDETEKYPYLKMAQGQADTGVIISYNAVDERMELPETKELSINPLNWKTDSTPAAKTENLGYVVTDTEGNITEETAEYCGAYLDEKSGKLVVTDIADTDEVSGSSSLFAEGDLHLSDLTFFYRNLEENIRARIEAYRNQTAEAEDASAASTSAQAPADASAAAPAEAPAAVSADASSAAPAEVTSEVSTDTSAAASADAASEVSTDEAA